MPVQEISDGTVVRTIPPLLLPTSSGSFQSSVCYHGNGDTNLVVPMDTREEGDDDDNNMETNGVEESLQWEKFFGPTVDLVPTLLDIYDALIADQHRRLDIIRPIGGNVADGVAGEKSSDQRSTMDNNTRNKNNNVSSTVDVIQQHSCIRSSSDGPNSKGPSPVSANGTNMNENERAPLSNFNDGHQVADSNEKNSLTRQPSTKSNRRPLSVSSTSSALSSSSSSTSSLSSSSCTSSLPRCHGNKKSYLASIESLEDDDDDDDDEENTKSPSGGGRCYNRDNLKGFGESGSQRSAITAPSLPQCKPRYCDPNLSYTDRVVLEIVETERTYVRDLNEIIEGYLCHLNDGVFDADISADNVSDLFGNVDEIYTFNRDFLEELERCSLDPVLVAQAFVAHTKGFAIYTEYCTNYPRTVSVLTDLMRRGKTAELFKAHQAALGHMLPLGSYLLKPVQRILKYHLLLQNMAKHYPKDRNGYDDVVAALATMTGIAFHINDMKRRHEHAVRVQEIQSLLYGWEGQDLTTYGELVAEGTFRVYGAKAVRHVFLFDKMLLITKKKEDCSLSYKTHITCSNLMLIESISGEPLCFHVIPFDSPRVQYTLQARNLEQKREWALQLKRVILENYDVDIPSHAREIVMQLGQNRPEDEILAERNNSSKRTHSAPEYLERRNKHERERRRMDNINRALRIRKGSKKRFTSPQLPVTETCKGDCHERSSSGERIHGKEMKTNLSTPSLQNHKSKKLRGWRRKSEPCELLSSQESLSLDTSYDRSPSKLSDTCNCSNNVARFGRSQSAPDAVKEEITTTDTDNDEIASLRYGHCPLEQELNDVADEYVTFLFAQRCNVMSPQSVSASDSGNQTSESHIYSVPCVRNVPSTATSSVPFYDNLQNLWSSRCGPSPVHRVHSFNSSCSSSDYGSYTNHNGHPDSLDLSSGSVHLPENLDSANSPTTPAVWLKQQQSHLAEVNSIKAGSLPRSFQVTSDSPSATNGIQVDPVIPTGIEGVGAFKLRRSVDRPFTIASDKPSQSDLNLDDFERYIEDSPCKQQPYKFPVRSGTEAEPEDVGIVTDHGDMVTESTEDITTPYGHPEHKIYRPSLSRSSLRSLIASVGSKLVGLRVQSSSMSVNTKEDLSCSCSSVNTDYDESPLPPRHRRSRSDERDKLASKLIFSVAHIYSRMIRQRTRGHFSGVDTMDRERRASSPCPISVIPVPIHKQGSPAIGARIARPVNLSEYSVPQHLKKAALSEAADTSENPVNDSSNRNTSLASGVEEDFAKSQSVTTCLVSVDGSVTDDSEDGTNGVVDESNHEEARSDVSGDSYYERTFEAIESLLETEPCRDSAMFSDGEDVESAPCLTKTSLVSNANKLRISLSNPEKVSALIQDAFKQHPDAINDASNHRIRSQNIMKKLRDLERCSLYNRKEEATASTPLPFKSIKERCKDLELWRTGVESILDGALQMVSGDNSLKRDRVAARHQAAAAAATCSLPSSPPEGSTLTKGWVKHMVDKLQSENK